MRLSAAVVLSCLLVGGTARARDHHREHLADARHHLEKANALAGDGKCAAAIKWFTVAYDKLKDPIVLFNRGECYRRLGENAKAAEDYRGFLKGFPAAPNRAELEARIATLEKPAAPPARVGATALPSAAGATGPAPSARTPAAGPGPSARTPTAAPPPPVRAPATVAHGPAAPPPAPAAPPEAAAPMPFLPPPPPAGGASATLVEAPRSAPSETPTAEASHGSRWWLWTTLAVVAVGGGFAAYWYLRPKDQPPPPTTLGSYRF
jgi:hypothetical protein